MWCAVKNFRTRVKPLLRLLSCCVCVCVAVCVIKQSALPDKEKHVKQALEVQKP